MGQISRSASAPKAGTVDKSSDFTAKAPQNCSQLPCPLGMGRYVACFRLSFLFLGRKTQYLAAMSVEWGDLQNP